MKDAGTRTFKGGISKPLRFLVFGRDSGKCNPFCSVIRIGVCCGCVDSLSRQQLSWAVTSSSHD
jgi:hypothetical protein